MTLAERTKFRAAAFQAGRRSAGFTLVELLVGITIVAVLVGLLASAVGRGKVAANRAACASNMRQIGVGLSLYASENDGRFPETTHGNAVSKSWIFTLAPYLGNIDEVRICPADPRGAERLKAGGTSYTLNSFVFASGGFDADGNRLPAKNTVLSLPRPAATILAFNVADKKSGYSADHTHSEAWTNWGALLGDIEPDRHRIGGRGKQRTDGSANYLFADGHVESIEAAVVKKRIEQGVNIARPPVE